MSVAWQFQNYFFFYIFLCKLKKLAVVIDNLKIYYLADNGVLFQAEILMLVWSFCHLQSWLH